jgi:hypothetical protein
VSKVGCSEADCLVRQGDLVAKKYRVDRILGAGGMGVVVAAALPATRAPSQAPLSGAVIAPDPSDQISRTPESKAEMDQDMLPSSATQDVAPGG